MRHTVNLKSPNLTNPAAVKSFVAAKAALAKAETTLKSVGQKDQGPKDLNDQKDSVLLTDQPTWTGIIKPGVERLTGSLQLVPRSESECGCESEKPQEIASASLKGVFSSSEAKITTYYSYETQNGVRTYTVGHSSGTKRQALDQIILDDNDGTISFDTSSSRVL